MLEQHAITPETTALQSIAFATFIEQTFPNTQNTAIPYLAYQVVDELSDCCEHTDDGINTLFFYLESVAKHLLDFTPLGRMILKDPKLTFDFFYFLTKELFPHFNPIEVPLHQVTHLIPSSPNAIPELVAIDILKKMKLIEDNTPRTYQTVLALNNPLL